MVVDLERYLGQLALNRAVGAGGQEETADRTSLPATPATVVVEVPALLARLGSTTAGNRVLREVIRVKNGHCVSAAEVFLSIDLPDLVERGVINGEEAAAVHCLVDALGEANRKRPREEGDEQIGRIVNRRLR